MMSKVFSKKLFGVRNEKITRNIFVCVALFGGIYGSGFNLTVAPFIIYLMMSVITIFEMWQALSADDNSQNMKNLMMLPFDNKEFIMIYVSSLGIYTFISRTLPVLCILLALSKPDVIIIVNTMLCVLNVSILTAVIFSYRKFRAWSLLWFAIIFALNFLYGTTYYYSAIILVSIVVAMLALMKADAYSFYIGDGKKNQVVRSRKKASVFVYIFRYMKAHKNYFVNMVVFWGVAIIFPITFKEFIEMSEELIPMLVPLGFSIMCLNTPMGILLSCDKSLEQAIRFLPGQKKTFCLPYCGFIFLSNMITEAIYLVSCYFQLGVMTKEWIIAAVFFAAQSAIIAVLLEWFFPIRNWKIENDLWHHPRKYVIPGIMVIIAGLIGLVPVAIYGLVALLVIESVYLLVAIQK